MKYYWQYTYFYDPQDLNDWMNNWDFIKVEHIIPYDGALIAYYRYNRSLGYKDIPTQEDFNRALWT